MPLKISIPLAFADVIRPSLMGIAALLLLGSATVMPGEWQISSSVRTDPPSQEREASEPVETLVMTSSDKLVELIRLTFIDPGCRLKSWHEANGELAGRQICNDPKAGRVVWTISGRHSPFLVESDMVGQAEGIKVTKSFRARFLASGPALPEMEASGREVVLEPDKWTLIGTDERLKLHLISDDRCPAGVLCEWRGIARVALDYSAARGFTRQAELAFPEHVADAIPVALCAWTRRIELVGVSPFPEKGVSHATSDYRFAISLGQCGVSQETAP